jgi:hypothetical protein
MNMNKHAFITGIGKTWTWIHGSGSLDTVKNGFLLIALHRLDSTLPNWELMWSDIDPRIRGCGIYCILPDGASGRESSSLPFHRIGLFSLIRLGF